MTAYAITFAEIELASKNPPTSPQGNQGRAFSPEGNPQREIGVTLRIQINTIQAKLRNKQRKIRRKKSVASNAARIYMTKSWLQTPAPIEAVVAPPEEPSRPCWQRATREARAPRPRRLW